MAGLYLLLAVLGAVVPYAYFVGHFAADGFGLAAFAQAAFANGAAGGFTADLLLSSGVFWIFLFHQRRLRRSPPPWLFVALNLLVGLSCALPAYLFARERMRRGEAGGVSR